MACMQVDALDDEMRDDLVDNLRKLGVKLDVVVLDTELDKPSPHTLQNQNTLDQLCAELQGQHTFRCVHVQRVWPHKASEQRPV